jgi:hypothetical protein
MSEKRDARDAEGAREHASGSFALATTGHRLTRRWDTRKTGRDSFYCAGRR